MKVSLYKENKKFIVGYYYIKNWKKKIINTVIKGDKGCEQRQNLARIITELRFSRFSYFTGSSNSNLKTIGDLILLLETSSSDTLENIVIHETMDFLDCYGTVNKTSETFFFRVYDENIMKRIKTSFYKKSCNFTPLIREI